MEKLENYLTKKQKLEKFKKIYLMEANCKYTKWTADINQSKVVMEVTLRKKEIQESASIFEGTLEWKVKEILEKKYTKESTIRKIVN
jgi:ADP-ribosylglycohydrolase